jgi:hypothetical protein
MALGATRGMMAAVGLAHVCGEQALIRPSTPLWHCQLVN